MVRNGSRAPPCATRVAGPWALSVAGSCADSAAGNTRAEGVFCAEHEAFWTLARRRLGDRDGTRALCEVLLLHRHLAHHAVRAGIAAALGVGSVDARIVALEARRAADARSPLATAITPLGAHQCGAERPLPVLAPYDELLAEVAG